MLPTVFGSYTDAERAKILVGALLEAGVAPEDMSVVIHTNGSPAIEDGPRHLEESEAGMAMVDSGEAQVPQFGHERIQTEGSYIYESKIGGGISTDTPDDSVSGVQDMDDGQEVAEEMIYPASAQSYSSQERFDVAQGADTPFFNTTDPGPESLGLEDTGEDQAGFADFGLTSLIVPAIGLVLGDGALATEAMGAGLASEKGGTSAATLQDYLQDQNVPRDIAFMLAKDFEEGGAVVAIAAPPGAADSQLIQDVLERNGANNVMMIEAID